MLSDLNETKSSEEKGERSFLTRDIVRFIAVDIVLILLVKLGLGLGLFPTPDMYVAGILFSKLILLCYLVWLIRDRRDAWTETGATTCGCWWGWLLSLALYAGYYQLFPLINGANHSLMTALYRKIGSVYVFEPQDVMIFIFSDILNQPIRWALVFFTIIVGPVMEELAFRGMGYDAYRRVLGVIGTALWTGLLFGVFHFKLDLIIPLGVLGVVFGIARALSGSLWCPILLHCFHNGLALWVMAKELSRL